MSTSKTDCASKRSIVLGLYCAHKIHAHTNVIGTNTLHDTCMLAWGSQYASMHVLKHCHENVIWKIKYEACSRDANKARGVKHIHEALFVLNKALFLLKCVLILALPSQSSIDIYNLVFVNSGCERASYVHLYICTRVFH